MGMLAVFSLISTALVHQCWGACNFKVVNLAKAVSNGPDLGLEWNEPMLFRGVPRAVDIWKGQVVDKAVTKESFRSLFANVRLVNPRNHACSSTLNMPCDINYTTYGDWLDQLTDADGSPFSKSYCTDEPGCMSAFLGTYGFPLLRGHYPNQLFFSAGTQSYGVLLRKEVQESWILGLAGVQTWFTAPQETDLQGLSHRQNRAADLVKLPGMKSCTMRPTEMIFIPAWYWRASFNSGPWILAVGGEGTSSEEEFQAMVGNASDLEYLRASEMSSAAAARGGHVELVDSLIDKCTSVKDCEQKGVGWEKAMTSAIWGRHVAVAELLGRKVGAALDGVTKASPTFIGLSVYVGSPGLVEFLFKRGAKIEYLKKSDLKTTEGKHLMHLAAECGHVAVADLLHEKRAKLEAKEVADGRTPLHTASEQGHVAMVKRLLEMRAKPKVKDAISGNEAMHYAALGGHISVVEVLQEAGVLLKTKNSEGQSLIDVARERSHDDFIAWVKEEHKRENPPKDKIRRRKYDKDMVSISEDDDTQWKELADEADAEL